MVLKGKRAYAATIAILALLIIAGAVLLSTSSRSGTGPGGPLVPIRGVAIAVLTSGGGTLNISVEDAANFPVTSIAVSVSNPTLNGLVLESPFTYNDSQVSLSNYLPIGEPATGFYNFTSRGVSGNTYTVLVSMIMTNGQVITGSQAVVAQA